MIIYLLFVLVIGRRTTAQNLGLLFLSTWYHIVVWNTWIYIVGIPVALWLKCWGADSKSASSTSSRALIFIAVLQWWLWYKKEPQRLICRQTTKPNYEIIQLYKIISIRLEYLKSYNCVQTKDYKVEIVSWNYKIVYTLLVLETHCINSYVQITCIRWEYLIYNCVPRKLKKCSLKNPMNHWKCKYSW